MNPRPPRYERGEMTELLYPAIKQKRTISNRPLYSVRKYYTDSFVELVEQTYLILRIQCSLNGARKTELRCD